MRTAGIQGSKFLPLLLWWISNCIFFMSCRQECHLGEVKKMMRNFYGRKVEFPDSLLLLNPDAAGDAAFRPLAEKENMFFIVHFFTADCDKCVNELIKADKYLESHSLAREADIIFIASAPTTIFVKEAIKKSGLKYPVYFEKKYFSFLNLNHLPLDDHLYRTMLLDGNKKLLLFGCLFDNKLADQLYRKIINCKHKKL